MENERQLAALREARRQDIKDYLRDYLGPESAGHLECLRLLEARDLSGELRRQLEFVADRRLEDAAIAVVPDEAWHKGVQPSESHVGRDLILVRGGYFDGQDEAAWLTHELTHLARYKDGAEAYQLAAETAAVPGSEAVYPNNEVERSAFTRQFEYLKSIGVRRERVRDLLAEQYPPEDLAILDRWLAGVFD